MKKKSITHSCMKALFCGIFLLLAAAGISRTNVMAAAGVIPMQMGKTYRSYDVTGDKKKDTVKLTQVSQKNSLKGTALYINNKKVYTLANTAVSGGSMELVTLKNGQVFFHIWTNEGMFKKDRLIQYKNGKAKLVADFSSFPKKYFAFTYVETIDKPGITVKNNTIRVRLKACSWTTGLQYLLFDYTYKNGTLKRTGTTGTVEAYIPEFKKVTAYRSIPVYKKVNSKERVFTVPANSKVTITKYYYNGKVIWYQLKNSSGRTGWVCGLTNSNYTKNRMFAETIYSS